MARINVPFGAALTQVAVLPLGSRRQLRDPFAEKQRPWKLYVLLLALLAVASLWFFERLDAYLPEGIRAQDVLGRATPDRPQPLPLPNRTAEPAKVPPTPPAAK